MIRRIALVLVLLFIGILGMAAMQPNTFSVTRSVTIKAPPEKILALVGDFHQWQGWSPWERLDPSMQRVHSGAPSGKGAVYAWTGNDDVGAGKMEITELTPPSRVVIKLDFIKPFEVSNVTEFTLVPKDGQTQVSWTMSGPMPFISKIMSVFMSMDRIIGRDFEKGLANLKAATEK
ncbi:SRPBCC family protein [Massilia sp. CCM 8734]|uniref:SRPBCC family protein n=1 Tax=Massilia sp. CCM 8734 TaxID=2609283 RepID=UPI0014234FD4|nr:SRPBCC family protein [Massilia sp. CCM 8734]NHZ95497.1 polyketide cyclase [Massilia sp. CCM 8734]